MQVLLFINNKYAHTGAGIKQYDTQHVAPAGADRLPVTDVSDLVSSSRFSAYRAAAKR